MTKAYAGVSMRHMFLSSILALLFGSLHLHAAALVYVPDDLNPDTANILVVLHGCSQTPETMALGTGFNDRARTYNTVIIYPRVPRGSHPQKCWSWYLPENQRADSGQLQVIMNEVERAKRTLNLKQPKVFAAGFSSGGSMVAGLLACYPNEFAGGIIHSGTPYGFAHTADEAAYVMSYGQPADEKGPRGPCNPTAFEGRVLVIQGLSDWTVNPSNAAALVMQFAPGTTALASRREYRLGTNYAVRDFVAGEDRERARLIKIHGLRHEWGGSDVYHKPEYKGTYLPFFSKSGPSATTEAWRFIGESLRPESNMR